MKLDFESLIVDEGPEAGVAELINGDIRVNQIDQVIGFESLRRRTGEGSIACLLTHL